MLRITALNGSGGVISRDKSNGVFTILATTIPAGVLGSPNGGETLTGGAPFYVIWGAQAGAASYKLHLTLDGTTWKEVGGTSGETNLLWQPPYYATDQTTAQLRISAFDGSGGVISRDKSDAVFTILATEPPPGVMGYPNGGEVLSTGSDVTVSWGTNPLAGSYVLHLSVDRGATWEYVTTVVENNTVTWTVPSYPADQLAWLRVTVLDGSGGLISRDKSDGLFTILK
jgi:hypothetical protein